MAICVTNCNLFANGGRVRNQDVAIQGDRIVYVGPAGSFGQADETIDLKDRWLSPGFIDIQVNGAGGALFQESITAATLDTMSAGLRSVGVTSFLPTLTTMPESKMSDAAALINQYREHNPHAVLGVNFEGPFINPDKAGMAEASYCKAYEPSFRPSVIDKLGGGRMYMTCAPEAVTAAGVADLRKAGVVVAIGHTTASVGDAHAFFDSGCRMATHLFNAMTGISGRDPGVAGAALARMDVACSLIADGHHIHRDTARLVHDTIGVERIALISDGMPPIGGEVQSFQYGENKISVSSDGKCTTEDGVLAGTAVGLNDACRNLAEWLSVDIASLVPAISSTPARILGVEGDYGSIRPGMVANLVITDTKLTVDTTIVAGDTNSL